MRSEEFSIDPKAWNRLIRWGILIAVLLLIVMVASSLLRLQADYWWYSYDANASIVFSTQIRTRVLLFLIGFVFSWFVLYLHGRYLAQIVMIFERAPQNTIEALITGGIGRIQSIAGRVVKFASPIVALFFGLSLTTQWENWLLFSHSQPFGRLDPIFSLDYSFFVFRLPFLTGIVAWLFGLFVVNALVAAGTLYLARGVASAGRIPLKIPSMRTHIHLLAAFGLALVGLTIWLNRFDAGVFEGAKFTGAGYAEIQALGAKTFTCWILFFGALVSLVSIRVGSGYYSIAGIAALALIIFVIGGGVWPAIVESYTVKPNEITIQTPYIARAIDATRWSYQLDAISIKDLPATQRPTTEELEKAEETLQNIRLWDPRVLLRNVDGLQALRDYYAFQDMDVDRYVVDGKQRLVMIGLRDLMVDQVDAGRKNWQSLHLQFTHGNGAAVVPVDAVAADGMPEYLLKDIPPRGHEALRLDQPRAYYSDFRGQDGVPKDRYIIVDTKLDEFDYTPEGESQYRWTSDGGVPIGSYWARLVYSAVFGDKDILFSRDILPSSRVLYRRQILERARHIFPFLKWDQDPYITIINGKLLWIMDGYTLTDKIPYSAMSGAGKTRFNYIRNSVKLTIEAYSGKWNAYVMDETDPILKVYRAIYPGLLKSQQEVPDEVRAHFRYPEDLFTIQAQQITLYHVTDPREFFLRSDAWEIPTIGTVGGRSERMPAYYLQLRLPEDNKSSFLLILPFTPQGRPNMVAWMAAHCDPDDYGQIILYRFPRDRNISGPSQQNVKFEQNPEFSRERTLLDQRGSALVDGNLLIIPIGNSVLYLKTYFLESARSDAKPLPELKLVNIGFSDRVAYGYSFQEAMNKLVGKANLSERRTPSAPQEERKATPPSETDWIAEAIRIMEEGDAALRSGDWAKYGDSQRKLRNLLEQAKGIGEAPQQ